MFEASAALQNCHMRRQNCHRSGSFLHPCLERIWDRDEYTLLLQKDSLGVHTCENNHVVDIDDVYVPNLFYVIGACIGSWAQRFDCI